MIYNQSDLTQEPPDTLKDVIKMSCKFLFWGVVIISLVWVGLICGFTYGL